jgi:4-hydroxy-3-polyprenylbenzoate decarboxylase
MLRGMTENRKNRLVIAITGASGVAYGVRALELLGALGVERHLVLSKAGERTILEETDYKIRDVYDMAEVQYPARDIGAAIASGSFRTMGMLVAPCSVKTMGEIRTGITSSLVSRAADVTLKERRRLVLMVRETPLHTGHLRTMTALSEMGAVIAPPVPSLYARPGSIDDMVTYTAARALDLFGLTVEGLSRWGETD